MKVWLQPLIAGYNADTKADMIYSTDEHAVPQVTGLVDRSARILGKSSHRLAYVDPDINIVRAAGNAFANLLRPWAVHLAPAVVQTATTPFTATNLDAAAVLNTLPTFVFDMGNHDTHIFDNQPIPAVARGPPGSNMPRAPPRPQVRARGAEVTRQSPSTSNKRSVTEAFGNEDWVVRKRTKD